MSVIVSRKSHNCNLLIEYIHFEMNIPYLEIISQKCQYVVGNQYCAFRILTLA